ncbi:zinc finger protein CONSTANS-LIKE 16-like [Coffea eugenioides]|uniref:zinc finger protein CONSTANS-LIKE 16-like n=1 Tax=Coffea eugenioides TaxID=49369 RepID=UPI000F606C25|nr:zinc finger protein CONSTANS-LIKE 16-like [Coffea eugenioides]
MVSDRKLANAMGGKTARACDNCIRKRARWYCAADDAFLCQNCDASVHSANPLARRHERVRLKTSSLKPSKELSLEISVPSWHHGFTKKARTPRSGKHAKSKSDQEPARNPLHLVPEICSDEIETSHEENEEQLLYRVPIFDPFVAELRTSENSNEAATNMGNDGEAADAVGVDESKGTVYDCGNDINQFHGPLPSEMELAEFAADVESLLGKGLDDESFAIEGLGLSDCKEADLVDNSSLGSGRVKVEDEGEAEVAMGNNQIDGEIDMSRDKKEKE